MARQPGAAHPAIARPPELAHRFHPPEDFLYDQLPRPLAEGAAKMEGGPSPSTALERLLVLRATWGGPIPCSNSPLVPCATP